MSVAFYKTRIGTIGIEEENGVIRQVAFDGESHLNGQPQGETPLLKEAARQLQEYLAGHRTAFELPLEPEGTAFMKRVWELLCQIPCGETRTYGQLAQLAGSPKGARAVGLACNRNPIPLFIPCHRVVGAGGSLTGYRGGIPVKKLLLELEQTCRD